MAIDMIYSSSFRQDLKQIITGLWHDSQLHEACHSNDLDALRKLLAEEDVAEKINATAAAPERGSWTALHVASFMNRLEAAELLLSHGADASLATSDNGGLTALHLASSRGNSEMVELLLRSMAANASNRKDGKQTVMKKERRR